MWESDPCFSSPTHWGQVQSHQHSCFPPSSFLLPSFVWVCIFFSTGQVLLSALHWCYACTSVSEGVFLMYLWREMYFTSTYSSAILFSPRLLLCKGVWKKLCSHVSNTILLIRKEAMCLDTCLVVFATGMTWVLVPAGNRSILAWVRGWSSQGKGLDLWFTWACGIPSVVWVIPRGLEYSRDCPNSETGQSVIQGTLC